jgi:hypothetical protein
VASVCGSILNRIFQFFAHSERLTSVHLPGWGSLFAGGSPIPLARDQRSSAAQPVTATICSTSTRAKGWFWYCG